MGSSAWSRALHRLSGEDSSVPIDFTTIHKDEYGYITAEWDIGALSDGEYEIEARTVCPDPTGDLPADFNFAATPQIRGSFDRIHPSLFGPAFQNDYYLVDEPIEIEFSEPLDCAEPHGFSLSVALHENRTLDNTGEELLVMCEGRSISFHLDLVKIDHDELLGKELQVSLSNVFDVNGNVYEGGAIEGVVKLIKNSNIGGRARKLEKDTRHFSEMDTQTTRQEGNLEDVMDDLHDQMMALQYWMVVAVFAVALASACVVGCLLKSLSKRPQGILRI